jgi:hypothetical protein
MPISRKKGESAEGCMSRAMRENMKKHPYKQALAISLSQCGMSNRKDEADWDFLFKTKYKKMIEEADKARQAAEKDGKK